MSTHIPDRATVVMACMKADTVDGVATALLKVPTGGRKINGGTAWFSDNHNDDKVKVFVTDEDNILGYGAGFVVAGYTDTGVPEDNQGWLIPYYAPFVQIERLVDFGNLPQNLYIKVVGITGDLRASTFRVNLHWGKPY